MNDEAIEGSEEQNIGIPWEEEAGAAAVDDCRSEVDPGAGKQCHLLRVEGQVRRDGWPLWIEVVRREYDRVVRMRA